MRKNWVKIKSQTIPIIGILSLLESTKIKKWLTWAVAIGIPLAGFIWMATPVYPFIEDDSLISLRYAHRLLLGKGLTWNDGEAVEGYSNLLWILLSAGLGALGIDLIAALRILGCFSSVLTLVVLFWIHPINRRGGIWPALVLGILFCWSSPIAIWSIGGLEQPLVAALLAFSLWRMAPLLGKEVVVFKGTDSRQNALLAGLPLALLCLTRPDGPLVVATFASVGLSTWLVRTGSRTAFARCALLIALPVVAWFGQLLFRWTYYGDWLPNPAYLKTHVRVDRLLDGMKYLNIGLRYLWPLVVLAIAGAAVGIRQHRNRPYIILLSTTTVTWIVYIAVIGGDHFPGHRHLILPIVACASLSAFAIERLCAIRRKSIVAAGFLVVVLLIAQFVRLQKTDPGYRMAVAVRWQWDGKVVGELFRSTFADKHPLWAVTAAGCLPYFSGLPALDMLGLNDRHIARVPPDRRFPLAHDHGDGKYVLDREPDLITFGLPVGGAPTFVSGEEMKRDHRFWNRYRKVEFEGLEPHRVITTTYVRIFGRVGIEQSTRQFRYPAYLLQGEVLGQRLLTGGMGARLKAGQNLQTQPLELEAGRWKVSLEPDNPLIRIKLQVVRGDGGFAPGRTPILELPRKRVIRFQVISPNLETSLGAIVVQKLASDEPVESSLQFRPIEDGSWVEARSSPNRKDSRGRLYLLLGNFDRDLDGWTPDKAGAAASFHAQRERPGQSPIANNSGGFINSFHPTRGDAATGSLRSPSFVVPPRAWLSLRVGGGRADQNFNQVGIRIIENGKVRIFVCGDKTENLHRHRIDLAAYEGRKLWLEIIDTATGSWGHVLADEIELRTW